MTEETKKEKKNNNNIICAGVDIGTMSMIASRNDMDKPKSIRNMFMKLDKDEIDLNEMTDISFIRSEEGEIFIIGDDAFRFCNIFGKEVNRPMKDGLISPKEIDAIDVLALMIQDLIGDTEGKDVYCSYSIPAESIDQGRNVTYHEKVFGRIFHTLGVNYTPVNEAAAIIYNECEKEGYSGCALSFGAGMANCLAGDTKVKLLDGTTPTIEELTKNRYDDTFWVYSVDKNNKIVPGLAHSPRKTKQVDKIYEITLDNGEVFKVTEDHPIMKSSGEFSEAKNLNIGDSLMPLRTKLSNKELIGYELVYQNFEGWKYTHRLVNKYLNENKPIKRPNVVHHKDFNKLNNSPDNLVVMHRDDHIVLHNKLGKYNLGKTYEEIMGKEKAEKRKKNMSIVMKELMKDKKFYNPIKNSLLRLAEYRKGKSFDEIHGEEQSKEIRQKMSNARIGRTLEELVGEEKAKELRLEFSKQCKEQCDNSTFGYNSLNEDQKKKMEVSQFEKGMIPWNKGIDTEEYKKHIDVDSISSKVSELWNNPDYRNRIMFSKGVKIAKECIDRFGKINKEVYELVRNEKRSYKYSPLKYDSWLKYYDGNNLYEDVVNWNHEITNIRVLYEEQNVYDLTVERHHNFAIDSGVFVHNCALMYKGVPVIQFSTARSGDYIDRCVAEALDVVPNRVTSIKEKKFDLNHSFTNEKNKKTRRILESLHYYYISTIEYTIKKIIKKFEEDVDIDVDEELPIIVSGGTSLPPGFLNVFKETLNKFELPFDVSEIRHAENPLTCVSEGLMKKTMYDLGMKPSKNKNKE